MVLEFSGNFSYVNVYSLLRLSIKLHIKISAKAFPFFLDRNSSNKPLTELKR